MGDTSIGGGLGVGYGLSYLSKSRLGIGACKLVSPRFHHQTFARDGTRMTYDVCLVPVGLGEWVGHHLVGVEEINSGPAVELIWHRGYG